MIIKMTSEQRQEIVENHRLARIDAHKLLECVIFLLGYCEKDFIKILVDKWEATQTQRADEIKALLDDLEI